MRNTLKLAGLLISVSTIALCTEAQAGGKKLTFGDFTISGGVQVGFATDRNAGAAPIGESSAGDSFDDDDDSGDMEDGDAFEDLDLTGDDLLDQLDETTDADGDGNFFNDGDNAIDPDLDPDGDGIPDEDADGDGIADPDPDADPADPDADPADPDADPADPDADPAPDAGDGGAGDADAGGGDAGGGDAEAIILDDSGDITNNALAARRARPAPTNIRDEHFTTKAKVGVSYKIGSWAKEWKAAAQVGTAYFDTLDKKDNVLFGFNTGPVFKINRWNAQIQPSFLFASLSVDGVHQFDNYGGGVAAQFDLTKMWQLGLRYGYDIRNFANAAIDNVEAHSGGAGLKYKLDKTKAIVAGYKARFENTTPDARAMQAHQFSLGYQQKWNNGFYVFPQVGYAIVERNGTPSARVPVRGDNRSTFAVAVGKNFEHGINVEAQYGNTDTDVNLVGKDSANDRFVLLTGWKF